MKIAIVPRLTRLEFDLDQNNFSWEELRWWLFEKGFDPTSYKKAHDTEKRLLDQLHTAHPEADVISRNLLSNTNTAHYDVIIAFGGDNHFQFVANFTKPPSILIGVNANPERSVGLLLAKTIYAYLDPSFSLEEILPQALTTPRLRATSGNQMIEGICDIFIGEQHRTRISRLQLFWDNHEHPFEYGCSGILVAAPPGWSGWYTAISGQSTPHNETDNFPLKVVVAEIYKKSPNYAPKHMHGSNATEFKIRYLSHMGIASADSLWEIPMARGETITIDMKGRPLRAIFPVYIPTRSATIISPIQKKRLHRE